MRAPASLPGLKACPFCGGLAELIPGRPRSFVMCLDPGCATEGPPRVHAQGAATAWNRRASFSNEWTKEIERLQKVNAELAEVLKEILEALRVHAPGTALNNHRFDALGIKANAAIAKAEGQP